MLCREVFFQKYPCDRVFQPVEPQANWTPVIEDKIVSHLVVIMY